MGFQDPLTVRPEDIEDGTLNPGVVIEGNLFRTAATGQRWEIDSPAFQNEMRGYTDDPNELGPGIFAVGPTELVLTSPDMGAGTSSVEVFADETANAVYLTGTNGVVLRDNLGAGVRMNNARLSHIGDEAWTAVLAAGAGDGRFLNSWVNFGGGTYQDAAYMLGPDGFVELRGFVKSGTAVNATIFNLPVGYRPVTRAHTQPSVANEAFCRIFVSPSTGAVSALTGGSTVYTSLYGIRFPVF